MSAVNGLVMAPAWGGGSLFGASWVVAALVLFGLSGVVWLGFLLRLQARMVRHSDPAQGPLSADFDRAFRQRSMWGGVTILHASRR